MSSFIARMVIALAISLLSSSVQARIWNFKKHPAFEAELVDVEGQLARLQRPTGEIVGWSVDSFKDADRKIVDAWLLQEAGDPPGDKTYVTATAHRETVRYMNSNSPPKAALVVSLKYHGQESANATSFSELKLDQVVADDGTVLPLSAQTPGYYDRPVDLSRYGDLEQPSWGFKSHLIWEAPQKPVQSLRRLSGSIKMFTGRPRSFLVDRIDTKQNVPVEDALLQQAGLQAFVNPPRSAGVFYAGQQQQKQYFLRFDGPIDRVFSVEMIDPKDQLIESFAGRNAVGSRWHDQVSGKRGASRTYQFEFWPPAPANLRLRVTVLEDVREVQVPFEFVDVAIPKSGFAIALPAK